MGVRWEESHAEDGKGNVVPSLTQIVNQVCDTCDALVWAVKATEPVTSAEYRDGVRAAKES